jgi:hypothetical protein
MQINNSDLTKRQYTMEELEKNINNLDAKRLLLTQKLTLEFCKKYILDMDIDNGSEESYDFDMCYILKRQPHLKNK